MCLYNFVFVSFLFQHDESCIPHTFFFFFFFYLGAYSSWPHKVHTVKLSPVFSRWLSRCNASSTVQRIVGLLSKFGVEEHDQLTRSETKLQHFTTICEKIKAKLCWKMYYFIFVYLIQLTALKMFEMPLFDCLHVLLPYTSTELHFCKLISYFLPHSIYLITLVSFFCRYVQRRTS